MFEGDNVEVERIERALVKALDLEHVTSLDAISALMNLMTLSMATIACVACRRVAADRLREAIPGMLETAGDIAADGQRHGLTPGDQPHLH